MSDAVADMPDELAVAVDVLVDAYGVSGAERELQERFRSGDLNRTSAAFSYLRREYPENQALANDENGSDASETDDPFTGAVTEETDRPTFGVERCPGGQVEVQIDGRAFVFSAEKAAELGSVLAMVAHDTRGGR